MMVDIDQLTNAEIRDQLKTHGCDPGPVVGSTRTVYANKLRRLLEEKSKSNFAVQSENITPDAVGNGILNPLPKRRDLSHSPQKSRSPGRATRSSTQEVTGSSKVQNTSLNSKLSQASPRTVDVPLAHLISDSKMSASKLGVVQSSPPTPPKLRVNVGLETYPEISKVPESDSPPSVPSAGSEFAFSDMTSSSFTPSKPYTFGKTSEVYRTTPTTRFTSLRDDWKNVRISDGSDDDLRGEESSRILLPSWKADHAYSARYDSKQNLMMGHNSDENSTTHYRQSSRYSSGAMFENSFNGHASRRISSLNKEVTSRSYGKIAFFLLFIIIVVIFAFFVVQNYAELEHGEGNNEEF